MLLTVMSAVGATPQLFSRVVTRELMLLTVEPKLLKFAMRGYRASDWPLDQQSQEMQRRPNVDPLPRMAGQRGAFWQSKSG